MRTSWFVLKLLLVEQFTNRNDILALQIHKVPRAEQSLDRQGSPVITQISRRRRNHDNHAIPRSNWQADVDLQVW